MDKQPALQTLICFQNIIVLFKSCIPNLTEFAVPLEKRGHLQSQISLTNQKMIIHFSVQVNPYNGLEIFSLPVLVL